MTPLVRWLNRLGRPAVFAHRGASRAAPENSLAALKLALEKGADGVEFDVQRCASGELVVFHDQTLTRCTGAIGSVRETTLDHLRRLTLDRVAVARGLRPAGERIPLLDEWLAEAPKTLFLNLEVKADVLLETDITRPCIAAVRRRGWADACVVSSFHPAALLRAVGADREIALGMLVDNSPHWREILAAGLVTGADAVHPEHSLVTPTRVRLWKRLGYRVATWTVDESDEAKRCLDAGVDIIITNQPDVIRPLVEAYRV